MNQLYLHGLAFYQLLNLCGCSRFLQAMDGMPRHAKDVIILLALYREVGVLPGEEENQQQVGSKVHFNS